MKCINCGFESEQPLSFCPNCGTEAQPDAVSQSTAAQKILCALKDKLFLVICILRSASCLVSLAAGSVPLIGILTTVFLWLTYVQSCKGIADAKHLRSVSGTVYAQYVINYVLAGTLLVVGVIFAAAFSFIAGDPEFMDALLSGFVDIDDSVATIVGMFASLSGGLILFVFALVAVIFLVLNIFSIRYIHRFAKSVYRSIESNTLALKHANATQIILFIFSGFSAISALSTLTADQLLSCISSGISCATTLIAGLLIRKHLSSAE